MGIADDATKSQVRERLLVELGRLEWAQELSQETLQDIASHAEVAEFHAGEIVHRPEEKITSVYFIVTGRLQATVLDLLSNEVLTRPLRRGSVLGLFSVASPDQSHLRVEAAEPSTVIRLPLSELLRLTSRHTEFQITMLRLAANVVKQLVMIDRTLPRPMVVGIVHHSELANAWRALVHCGRLL